MQTVDWQQLERDGEATNELLRLGKNEPCAQFCLDLANRMSKSQYADYGGVFAHLNAKLTLNYCLALTALGKSKEIMNVRDGLEKGADFVGRFIYSGFHNAREGHVSLADEFIFGLLSVYWFRGISRGQARGIYWFRYGENVFNHAVNHFLKVRPKEVMRVLQIWQACDQTQGSASDQLLARIKELGNPESSETPFRFPEPDSWACAKFNFNPFG